MKKILLGTIFLSLISCTTKPNRSITSVNTFEEIHELLDDVDTMGSIKYETHQQCSDNASGLEKRFLKLSPGQFDTSTLSKLKVQSLTKRSFEIRLKIKNATKIISNIYSDDAKCLNHVIGVSRALRYLEDYLMESQYLKDEKFITFKSDGMFFQRNVKYKFDSIKDLESGDIILSRGNAYASASIARVGNADSQFSHLSFVYIDKNNKIFTTEAHIEVGSLVSPISQNINQNNARSVVLRYKDQALAHRAAKMIFEKVKASTKNGKTIPYDFKMNYKSASELFCSEIVSYGFKLTSNGTVDIPYHKTFFQPGISSFLSMLGIKSTIQNPTQTFAPADVLFDPRFEIIAEWRNPSQIKDAREKDAIITKMLEWIQNEDYVLKPKVKYKASSYLAWVLRRIPWIKKSFEDKFPLIMTTKTLQLFMVLDHVAEHIHKQLKSKTKTKSHPLGFEELYIALEEIKTEDLERYKSKNKRNKRFHKYFNNF